MRVIIAGSRTIKDLALVEEAVRLSGFDIDEVVSGKEPNGVDALGEAWAEARGIPVAPFPANWRPGGPGTKIDRSAGFQRNTQMGLYAKEKSGGLIAVWDGVSPGTAHMVTFARRCKLHIYIHRVPPKEPS